MLGQKQSSPFLFRVYKLFVDKNMGAVSLLRTQNLLSLGAGNCPYRPLSLSVIPL
jgi:hypothetical protein